MKTLAATLAYCKNATTHPTEAIKSGGLCLQFCREAWGAPLIGAHDANQAWNMTSVSTHHGTVQPPPGALVYFATGAHGHVVVADADWWCWSTDIVTHGRLSRVPISRVLVQWGATYRGWVSSYGSHKLPLFG